MADSIEMPALPVSPTDEIQLADWLEISALLSDDKNSSSGDLERALRRSSVLEIAEDQEAVERMCQQVFRELEDRARSAGDSYPFTVHRTLLKLRSAIDEFPAYIFCLCLSYYDVKQPGKQRTFPRRMFEDLACLAAKNYLGGKSLRFASPRVQLPKPFKEAVGALCFQIGEGRGDRHQAGLSSKDAGLDVVAWKDFLDARPGKLIVFGQCTSGKDWKSKVGELNPVAFCSQWMEADPVTPVVKAFFIPHRIAPKQWEWINRRAGMVFDRCRLSFWVHREEKLGHRREVVAWYKATLKSVGSGVP